MVTRLITNLTAFANPRLYREALQHAERYSKEVGSLLKQHESLQRAAEEAIMNRDFRKGWNLSIEAGRAAAKAASGHFYSRNRALSAAFGVLGGADDLSIGDVLTRRYGAYLAAATGYRLVTGGSPLRNSKGERDIIGIPFI